MIGLINGWAPSRRQAIIWTNHDYMVSQGQYNVSLQMAVRCIQSPNDATTVPADGLALSGARTSAGTLLHYSDVIMGAIASQITSLPIVYSTVCSGDQRKHQSSASLAFVREIHRWPVNSPHKWTVTRKMFPFDNVIMECKLMNVFF